MKHQPSSRSLGEILHLDRWLRLTKLFLAFILFSLAVSDAGAVQGQQSSDEDRRGGSTPAGWVNPSDPNLDNHTIFLAYDRINENRFLAKLHADETIRLVKEREDFLQNVDGRLSELREHFEKAKSLRLTMDQESTSTAKQRRAQTDFQLSLGKLEESAHGLHEMLVPAVPGMESKKDLQFQGTSDEAAFEMDFMGQQIETAENQFRRQSGEILQWPGEETILVCLHWVETMARTVRESE